MNRVRWFLLALCWSAGFLAALVAGIFYDVWVWMALWLIGVCGVSGLVYLFWRANIDHLGESFEKHRNKR